MALLNWSRPEGERITAGVRDVDDAGRRAALRTLLRAEPHEDEADEDDDADEPVGEA